MTLVEFLLARIAEDEVVAKRAAHLKVAGPLHKWHPDSAFLTSVGMLDRAERVHIARHDPARVLADAEAKRRIVEEHSPVDYTDLGMRSPNACHICGAHRSMGDWEWDENSFPCYTLRTLATVYADHPDYREEWRP